MRSTHTDLQYPVEWTKGAGARKSFQSPAPFSVFLFSFRYCQKSCRRQAMEDNRKHQAEGHTQDGIYNTKDHRSLESVDSGPQHQRTKTVHCRFIPLIDAKAQTQSF